MVHVNEKEVPLKQVFIGQPPYKGVDKERSPFDSTRKLLGHKIFKHLKRTSVSD